MIRSDKLLTNGDCESHLKRNPSAAVRPMKPFVLSLSLLLFSALCGQAQVTSSVQVASMAPNNRTVAVYYRVPKDCDAARQAGRGRDGFSRRGAEARRGRSQSMVEPLREHPTRRQLTTHS